MIYTHKKLRSRRSSGSQLQREPCISFPIKSPYDHHTEIWWRKEMHGSFLSFSPPSCRNQRKHIWKSRASGMKTLVHLRLPSFKSMGSCMWLVSGSRLLYHKRRGDWKVRLFLVTPCMYNDSFASCQALRTREWASPHKACVQLYVELGCARYLSALVCAWGSATWEHLSSSVGQGSLHWEVINALDLLFLCDHWEVSKFPDGFSTLRLFIRGCQQQLCGRSKTTRIQLNIRLLCKCVTQIYRATETS